MLTELLRAVVLGCWRGFAVRSEGAGFLIRLLSVGEFFCVQRPLQLECMVSHLVEVDGTDSRWLVYPVDSTLWAVPAINWSSYSGLS